MTDEELIARYIEPNPFKVGASEVRLADSGVSVWAIIGYYHAVEGDATRVAEDYEVSPEEVRAALAYYERNKKAINARLIRNVA